MNPTQLGGVVKRVYPNFDMTNFRDRLKLQKFIYLMQSCDLNLGYNFRLYLHGPYATQLARDGFDMPNFQECQVLKFGKEELETIFTRLIEFMGNKKDSSETMEILGSLYLFHKLFPNKTDEQLIQMVTEKSPIFNGMEREIKILLLELKGFGEIRW